MPNLKHLLFCAGLMSGLVAFGQSKINPAGNLLLNEYKTQTADMKRMQVTDASAVTYPATILTNDPVAAQLELLDLGIEITGDIDGTFIVDLPVDLAEAVAALPSVKYVDFGRKLDVMMDYARPSSKVKDAQEGFTFNGETRKFDGTGVVAGMFDTGLEANHVNFKLDDGTGASRIQRLFWYRSNGGNPTVYTPANIKQFSSDDNSESHATHVAGIMAGSYRGSSTYAYVSKADGASGERKTGNMPYYGVAPGADLAFAVGPLYTASILSGVTKIIDYAESEGKPCVVNLSLGSTDGPHDGTDAYSTTMDALGKRGIICVAAGNDGDLDMSIVKEFTASDQKVQTMIADNTGLGIVDIWGRDNSAFKVTWAIYNSSTKTFTTLATVSEAGKTATISNATNANFAAAFNGSIQMQSSVNALNNRYNVYNYVSVKPLSTNRIQRLALIVEGSEGQKVWIYGNGNTAFTSNSLVGWTKGSPDNSINGGCCSDGVISVGSYNTRTTWGILPAGNGVSVMTYTGSFSLGGISPFSSYGTTFQGVELPTVAAPGANIISSYSRFYVSSKSLTNNMTANAKVGVVTDYWGPMQGTSMACPHVSGIVALWLEACPTLTVDQIKDVIEKTSVYKSLQMRPKIRWGAGMIDAVAGLKEILQNHAAIGSVWDDDAKRLLVTPTAGGYDVTLAGEARFEVTVVDLQGRTVATATGIDGAATVDASGLASGVYVLAVKGESYSASTKIVVR